MNIRTTPSMRRLLLMALLVTGACEQQRPPIPITYVPQGQAPASDGTAAAQDSRRVNRAMAQETRQDRAADSDPYAGSMAGTPTPSTQFEVGGNEPESDVPQISIPFSGI
jgi:predicted lipid-binding transport protein (Tim44 family)